MSAAETPTHYPLLVPVSIRALELTLARLEVPDDDPTLEDLQAFAALQTALTHAQAAQRTAMAGHPRLIPDEPDHDAANVIALPVTSNKGGAVDTAAAAARAIEVKAGDRRAAVLAKLVEAGEGGRTDYEVDGLLGWEHGSAGKRRVELRTLGLVKRAPLARTRTLPGRRPAAVWVATDKAAPCLEALGYTVTVEPGFIPELGDVITVTAP